MILKIKSVHGYITCYWFPHVDTLCPLRVPLEILALREPADPLDLL